MNPADVLPPRNRGEPVAAPIDVLDEWALSARHTVAVVRDGAGRMFVVPRFDDRRAVPGNGTAAALLAAASGCGRFQTTSWHRAPVTGERSVDVDQTNESVIVGDRAVVKWSLRADTGPAADRITTLADADFAAMPRPWAVVRWHGPDGPVLVATIVDYLPGAVDGWTWAVSDARAYAAGQLDLVAATAPAATIGSFVAELHGVLAGAGVVPAAAEVVAGWATSAHAELAEAILVLDGAEGERLRDAQAGIAAELAVLGDVVGTPTMPVHGDLHVGQVLRHGDPSEYVLTDFDGNPVLPGAERHRPQPAAVDVAGMLQALDHVGRVVVYRTPGVDTEAVATWVKRAQDGFLAAYREDLGNRIDVLDDALLRPLRVRQVVREYLYAARHLPHWRYVPDTALPDLLDGAG